MMQCKALVFTYSSLLQNSTLDSLLYAACLSKQIHTRADGEHGIFVSLQQLEQNNINRPCGL